ncbi:MAG: hypothetical protein JST54_34535, partial [Deltaproteobacteria bacterium]|nr:hypothetical protein [Deltaproteobacteria bacterium]
MLRVIWALFALHGAGCSTHKPPPATDAGALDGGAVFTLDPSTNHHSGSRLRANLVSGGSGATLFQGWHDSQLNADCAFQLMVDGSWRCLPTSGNAAIGFLDASCTQPVAVVGSNAPVPTYASAPQAYFPVCGSSPTVMYALGAAQSPAQVYFPVGIGKCQSFGPYPGQSFYAVTPADDSTFVGAHLATAHHGDLDLELLVGDDGSGQIRRVLDPNRNVACHAGSVPPNQVDVDTRCIPAPDEQVSPGFFLDSTCTNGSFAVSTSTCGDPSLDPTFEATTTATVSFDGGLCEVDTDVVRALGPRQAASAIYTSWSTGCTPQTMTTPTETVFPELAQVDPSTLPAIHLGQQGSGRLTAPVFFAADGTDVGSGQVFWDTAHHGYCTFDDVFSDGVLRCVDDARATLIGTDAHFSNSTCTVQLATPHSGNCRGPAYALDFGPG